MPQTLQAKALYSGQQPVMLTAHLATNEVDGAFNVYDFEEADWFGYSAPGVSVNARNIARGGFVYMVCTVNFRNLTNETKMPTYCYLTAVVDGVEQLYAVIRLPSGGFQAIPHGEVAWNMEILCWEGA